MSSLVNTAKYGNGKKVHFPGLYNSLVTNELKEWIKFEPLKESELIDTLYRSKPGRLYYDAEIGLQTTPLVLAVRFERTHNPKIPAQSRIPFWSVQNGIHEFLLTISQGRKWERSTLYMNYRWGTRMISGDEISCSWGVNEGAIGNGVYKISLVNFVCVDRLHTHCPAIQGIEDTELFRVEVKSGISQLDTIQHVDGLERFIYVTPEIEPNKGLKVRYEGSVLD